MGVMPYRLEKGPFPLIVEHYFNEGLDEVNPGATAQDILGPPSPSTPDPGNGARRRLRAIWRYCEIGHQLRHGSAEDLATVTPENSLIHSGIFRKGVFGEFAQLQLDMQKIIGERWLGLKRVDGTWQRPPPPTGFTAAAGELPTVGHWSAYYGNVELIMVETLQRMLEVSLGVDHLANPPTTPDEQAEREEDLRRKARRVWPVYMFLTCPQPWFETWVTWQCHANNAAVRGQVTVMLSTPGHERPVTPSPVDLAGDSKTMPAQGMPGVTVPNPYFLHGEADEPFNSGYEGKVLRKSGFGATATVAVDGHDPVNTSRHEEVGQGMWVITHANHDSTVGQSTFGEAIIPDFDEAAVRKPEAWNLPPIAHFRFAPLLQRKDVGPRPEIGAAPSGEVPGYRDVVVVSPASLDGGVPSVPLPLSDLASGPGGDDATPG